jgi:hypothetical protein
MSAKVLEEAIANIAYTSAAIEKYCNDPDNHCSPIAAALIEQMSWDLHKKAKQLKEINYLYIS